MAKDDNPFGTESSGTDAFGRPISGDDDPFGTAKPAPAPEPASSPPPPSGDPWQAGPAPPPSDDPWQAGPAPPPTGDYAAPAPGKKAEGAIPALVLGLIGIVLCPLCAPIAWSLGRKAERLVDASGGTLGGRGEATAGKILGIIGTAFIVIGIVLLIGLFALGTSIDSESGGTTTTFEFQ